MKLFFENLKKYKSYILYSTKAGLKSEVASSYLNWLWWILDPLLFMFVYSFVAIIVFGKGEPYFPIFVFIGLNIWKFFNSTVVGGVKTIRSNKGLISKVYLPKYILIIISMLQNLFKMAISFLLVFGFMPFYRVPLSWKIFNVIPLFILLFLLSFGLACWLLDIGVYVADAAKLIPVILRLLFYLSGIFYSIPKRIPENLLPLVLYGNPMAFIIDGARQSLIYDGTYNWIVLLVWYAISLVLIVTGVSRIKKHENNYVKVI